MSTQAYETHITVACQSPRDLDRLTAWAVPNGAKVTHIVLARGRTPSQPMLTLKSAGAGLPAHREAAFALAERARSAGFPPVRVKIETVPWAPEAPQEDAAAGHGDPATYFEHHVKLALPTDFDRERLLATVVPHDAHLSWNARRAPAPATGRQERFVTQRCHAVGARTAGGRLAALLADIDAGGYEVLSVEREFVVLDSDLSVDDGWMVAPAARTPGAAGAVPGARIKRVKHVKHGGGIEEES